MSFLLLLPWPRLLGSPGVSAPRGTTLCRGLPGGWLEVCAGLAAPARGWWVWGLGGARSLLQGTQVPVLWSKYSCREQL